LLNADPSAAAASGSTSVSSVSLVVCTYTEERLPLLRDLLRSVAAGSRKPDETLVVVDRAPELEARLRHELETSEVQVLGSPAGGLSAARNTGWRAARSDWVAFVDDDALVATSWLEILTRTADDLGSAIAGGRIDPCWPPGGASAWYTRRLGWVVGCSYRGQPTRTTPVQRVIGCNMLIRRAVLDELGGFATDLGALIHYVPHALVWQVVPPSRRRLDYLWRRSIAEGRSKARLASLHGQVLGTESRYSRELVGEGSRLLVRGALRRDRAAFTRGAAQMVVLTLTGSAYLLERARQLVSRT
jgi:glycosyltransferase involved in cell wall biosynthesis